MWMPNNKGLTGASVLTAGLASLCCIGPLAAAAIGTGAFGVGTLFDSLRPYMLAATVALLGTAFYLAYRRDPDEECADGSCGTR
jgi:mercuric ion transport protein